MLIAMVVGIGMIIRSFFGWSPDSGNQNIPQSVDTWFIQELTQTGNVEEKNPEIKTPDIPQKEYTEIRVMMPKYFYNSGWKKFAEDLYADKKIYMNFILIDDLTFYRNQLYNPSFSGADLFLFPYDWNEKISTRTFVPQNSLQSYFDDLLASTIKDNQVSFLPFSADPLIMYAITWYTTPNNFPRISEYVTSRESIKPMSFPLFFGINSEDLYDKWFTRECQDIVWYALMHYFKTNNDSHDLQIRIDTNVLQKYNVSDLNTILNLISAPECKSFPSLCFQIYGFVGLRFWFLSDADVVNTYFTWKKNNFEKLSKLTVPFFQLESPVRLRWRWIRGSLNDAETINAIYSLFKQYMDKHNEYPLRKSTIPVFKTEWNNLIDNEYIWLRWYILQNGWDYINTLKWMNKFVELIDYQITAKEYLR